MAELKNEEQKLQILVNKFDPKLKLNELKDLSYNKIVNWIAPVQREIKIFKDRWKGKINEVVEDTAFTPFYKTSYQNTSSIIHCFDEERYHLNNTTGFARFTTPFEEDRGVYFYTFPFNEYIAYQIAKSFGWRVPETALAFIHSPSFHDILGQPEEKICSVKKKITNAIDPFEYIAAFFKKNNDKPIKDVLGSLNSSIDQQAFEDAYLFTLLIGEVSGSPSKYLLVAENEKMAFIKSNSLTCLSSNYFETDSFLNAFPHINQTLSEKNRLSLLEFDETPIIELMNFFEKKEGAIACFKDRVRRMKEIASKKEPLLKSFVFIGLRKKHWKVESFLLKLYHEGIAFT